MTARETTARPVFTRGQRSDQSLVDRRRIAMMAASCCEWLWVCLSLSPLLLVFSAARDDNGMIFNPYVAYLIIWMPVWISLGQLGVDVVCRWLWNVAMVQCYWYFHACTEAWCEALLCSLIHVGCNLPGSRTKLTKEWFWTERKGYNT